MTGLDNQVGNKQCIWIVRYGLTKYPLIENEGPYDSELDPNEGMDHAKAIASRISRTGEGEKPSAVYCSPFVRTTHTAQLISLDLSGAPVRVEEGLTEWQIPSLLVDKTGIRTYPKSTQELAEVYGTIDLSYKSLNPAYPDDAVEVPKGAPHYEESENKLLLRCSTTLNRILDFSKGQSFVVVSHAPCDQAIALALEGKGARDSKLGPWPLGGITKFSRQFNENGEAGEWELEIYGDTAHMPGKYKEGLKEWSLPILSGRKVEKHASFDAVW